MGSWGGLVAPGESCTQLDGGGGPAAFPGASFLPQPEAALPCKPQRLSLSHRPSQRARRVSADPRQASGARVPRLSSQGPHCPKTSFPKVVR